MPCFAAAAQCVGLEHGVGVDVEHQDTRRDFEAGVGRVRLRAAVLLVDDALDPVAGSWITSRPLDRVRVRSVAPSGGSQRARMRPSVPSPTYGWGNGPRTPGSLSIGRERPIAVGRARDDRAAISGAPDARDRSTSITNSYEAICGRRLPESSCLGGSSSPSRQGLGRIWLFPWADSGGADAVIGSIADLRLGQWSPGAPEACPSVQPVPSWWDALAGPATNIRRLPDGQIFDVITNRTGHLSAYRCLSPRVSGG